MVELAYVCPNNSKITTLESVKAKLYNTGNYKFIGYRVIWLEFYLLVLLSTHIGMYKQDIVC